MYRGPGRRAGALHRCDGAWDSSHLDAPAQPRALPLRLDPAALHVLSNGAAGIRGEFRRASRRFRPFFVDRSGYSPYRVQLRLEDRPGRCCKRSRDIQPNAPPPPLSAVQGRRADSVRVRSAPWGLRGARGPRDRPLRGNRAPQGRRDESRLSRTFLPPGRPGIRTRGSNGSGPEVLQPGTSLASKYAQPPIGGCSSKSPFTKD